MVKPTRQAKTPKNRAWWTGIALGAAVAHLLLFLVLLRAYGQALDRPPDERGYEALIWVPLWVADVPIFVFYETFELPLEAPCDYLPIGLLGTIQWFCLGALLSKATAFCWNFGAEDEADAGPPKK